MGNNPVFVFYIPKWEIMVSIKYNGGKQTFQFALLRQALLHVSTKKQLKVLHNSSESSVRDKSLLLLAGSEIVGGFEVTTLVNAL